ncbi:MBL fold metallo-hydrolase [Labilibaculum sp. K2S]|uniref:MBL fold metallo-hydrolase n=1 Tax=Labilibaculum sp. K2S TaxID=3056386 RepID=UPI0025A3CE5D|nr:MBL fold metallo-hydrolase [Labilibaculum sp. K2S]MDM8160753.1 MBL fold metallo-hydrolase [Labilibaculum sp. K2S]
MIVKILVDNTAKEGFEAVHGFSAVVEADEKILFDVGPNSLFIENAGKMGVDLDEINTLVLSHGHWDHGDGLQFVSGKRLITHPDSFSLRFRKESKTTVGLKMTRNEIAAQFELKESKLPVWISEKMVYLGEIPRLNDFESQSTTFLLEDGSPDFVADDSALGIKSEKGLIVISGCAHAGICNTVAYAKEVCGEDKVYAVLGGFHLKILDEVFQKTVTFFREEKLEILGATHCTSFLVQNEFKKYFKTINLEAGVEVEL